MIIYMIVLYPFVKMHNNSRLDIYANILILKYLKNF